MRHLVLTLTLAAVAGCSSTSSGPAKSTATSEAAIVATTTPAEPHVHDLTCGCTLGLPCQKMISVDGRFVPLTGPAVADLGNMAFCGKKGLRARAEGTLEGGKFVASSVEMLPAAPAK